MQNFSVITVYVCFFAKGGNVQKAANKMKVKLNTGACLYSLLAVQFRSACYMVDPAEEGGARLRPHVHGLGVVRRGVAQCLVVVDHLSRS